MRGKGIKRNRVKMLFIPILVTLIVLCIKTYADDNLSIRKVNYKKNDKVVYEFDVYTDCTKFHTKASGYDKYKGLETDNNMNSIIDKDKAKMQGYGNYEFKADTNLFSFIDYCYSKEPVVVKNCASNGEETSGNRWNFEKLISYRGKQVNTALFEHFWKNMSSKCALFKEYQDDFFFSRYTYPATKRIGISIEQIKKAQDEEESVKEYLTCLTSYVFSITPSAQVENMTFGKGDLVPFLYYKDKEHANVDVEHDSDAFINIAKHAYVALIEGWCKMPTPYHLWENEYQFLFGTYNPSEYDLEELRRWYDKTSEIHKKDKGKKGNNLLGSKIEYIIESDYSIEEQLEATEHYIRGIFSDLGIETDFKETMARNELMAKYMMQNSSFKNSIKDYSETISFMTENLQRGTHEAQNTHTVVTSDFQVLEFPYTMDRRFREHSDEDGISDGVELGNEKWMNITEFVRKTYEDAVRKGEPHKATFEEQVEDIIEKNGAYTDFGGNKVYGSVKWNDDKTKVLYRVYDYKSNPKLNDTDFDGIWDNKEKDELKLVNRFEGTSTDIGNVKYNQDFRWFFTDNKKYNDELAVMSLIMSNLADGKTVNTDQASGDISTYLTSIGFSNIQNIGEGTDNIYIAKKTIQYYDNKKDVIGVFLGKCDRWYSEVIKFKEDQKVQTNNVPFKESLESYINRIVNKINLLETSDCSYWVAGYDVGGSIASEVASELVEEGKTVYAYTFGAFNTRDKLDAKNEIKNIRNEDDFIIKYIKGTKPGQSYGASIFENLMFEYRDLTESWDYESKYEFSNFLLKIYDETKFSVLKNGDNNINISRTYSILGDHLQSFNEITDKEFIENYADIMILLNKYRKSNKQAHSIKSYYVLAKCLNGFDILDGNGEKQEHYRTIPETMVFAFNITETITRDVRTVKEALKIMSEWYLNNVATYKRSLQTMPLYEYRNGFNYMSKYSFLNADEASADYYVMTTLQQEDAKETIDLTLPEVNTYLTKVNEMHRNKQLKTEEQLKQYLNDFARQDILRANEKQAKSYRANYNFINKAMSEYIYYYMNCEYLSSFNFNGVGDDCTRFAFAVLQLGTGENAQTLGDLNREANQFIFNSNINELSEGLRNHFDIYQGEELIDMFKKGLKCGDMIVGKKGDGNNYNHCEFIFKDGKTNQTVYNVFGWGKVKYTSESQACFAVDGNYIKDSFNSDFSYSTLYREKETISEEKNN